MFEKGLGSVKTKVPESEVARVLATIVDGKKIVDHVTEEYEKRGPNTRLSTKFWTPLLRVYRVHQNPLADASCWSREKVEWPVAFVEALTDCQSENACQRGHGILALKACLDETPNLADNAVCGLFNTVFELQCTAASFKDRMLVTLLAWLCRWHNAISAEVS